MKGKRSIKRSQRPGKRILSKRAYILMVLSATPLLVLTFYYLFFYTSAINLEYSIKPYSTEKKLVQVSLKVSKRNRSEDLELYKGDSVISDFLCFNDSGKQLKSSLNDNLIEIAAKTEDTVNIEYKVYLGDLAKHGHRGGIYEDMLTFDGEAVLLLPSQAYTEAEDGIKKIFKKLHITYHIPNDWTACVPFESKTNSQGDSTSSKVDVLTWSKLYEIRKACYAFGKFTKFEVSNNKSKMDIFIDPQNKMPLSSDTKKGIANLYTYYAKLFNQPLPHFSLVLLRKDPNDNSYILGGSGSQTLGTTFEPDNKRDWELMGHRFFHAFFDADVPNSQFHIPAQLWFYEGLATYYENMSMGSLPDVLKKKLGVDVAESFKTLYSDYLYARFKDPALFTLIPMSEEKIAESDGQTEFLHYTQAPLIIKALEDMKSQKNEAQDSIIKYIMDKKTENINSLEGIIKFTLGDRADTFAKQYLFGTEVLQLWYLSTGKEESAQVISNLNDFEYYFWTWFRLEIKDYPIDRLSDDGLTKLAGIAQKENANFAPIATESQILKFSPTLFKVLKQYALMSKVCGIDYNDPLLRMKLLGDKDNIAKWEEYKSKD